MAAADPGEGLASQYDFAAIEGPAYKAWEEGGFFDSTPRDGKDGYCILLPPPNVTGELHMGHAFQHAVMDALIRRQRMAGGDVLWQAGTDHAGVGTHIVVSRHLRGLGIDPDKLSRAEFMEKVLEWKDGSASRIGKQMRRLGDSCDWPRECFTLDPELSKVVRDVFIRLHEEGLIYRGKRLVNWDPKLLTALADLEVVSNEEEGMLYYVRYPFLDPADGDGVIIATTRPETILVDGAVAVAPGDERYAHLIGKRVLVPCTDRSILIIADLHVNPEFGSGCVKITAAHDFNDYEVAMRHPDIDIPILELMTPTAHMNDNAPPAYRGLDRYAAREKIVADLDSQNLLIKSEPHRYKLPRGERSGVVVEPMLSDQWYLRSDELAKKALAAVDEGRLEFVPGQWKTVYANWLRNIKDWCISRQIDWGHRIPAWEDQKGNIFVAEDEKQAQAKAGDGRELTQVNDVLDTWFSSALWPLSTLGWPDEANPHFTRYFPTSTLVTGNDIIFFWVARMVMMSEHLTGKVPFRKVFMHGLVRDKNGEKMSKSRGNVLDPLDLIDGISLEKLLAKRVTPDMSEKQAKDVEARTRHEFPEGIPPHGADALRLTFLSLASHGRDINFDLARIDGHRRLCTKLWQAARFVLAEAGKGEIDREAKGGPAQRWIRSRAAGAAAACAARFAEFRFDLLVEEITSLLRDDFCDWYIELAKTELGDEDKAPAVRGALVDVLGVILRLAHPLIPFITNELWAHVGPLALPGEKQIICAPYPDSDGRQSDDEAEEQFADFRALVHDCRSLRSSLGMSPGLKLPAVLEMKTQSFSVWHRQLAVLARLDPLTATEQLDDDGSEPILDSRGARLRLEVGGESSGWRERMAEKLAIAVAARDKTTAKLANENFIARAPAEVVAGERARLTELESQISALREIIGGSD